MFIPNLSKYTKKHTEQIMNSVVKGRTKPTSGTVNDLISYLETAKWPAGTWADSKRGIEKPPI